MNKPLIEEEGLALLKILELSEADVKAGRVSPLSEAVARIRRWMREEQKKLTKS